VSGLLILLGVGLAVAWGLAVGGVAWVLSHPPRRTYASAVSRGRPGDPSELEPERRFESWTFRSGKGRELPVWEIGGDDPEGPIIVATHGWADSRIGGLVRVGALARRASTLILWDIAGHGETGGRCTLGVDEAEDLQSLLSALRREVGDTRGGERAAIVLYGWSLGAGVSIEVAARGGGVAGVIAEAPYRLALTPARNVLRERGLPWRGVLIAAPWLISWRVGTQTRPLRYDRARHASKLPCPLVVIHGDADAVCPIQDGRDIAAAAPQGQIVEVAGAGHNDLWTDDRFAPICADAVREFLRHVSPTLRP
jgi:pimeloyl-ACP methyl ester carboxylesterase